ncbi:MAG: DUF1501 domain-containing protein [Pirellulaceae bacterium]|jgi:hypothetical protein|nr:DUF1501 domain-containing protein [Pirellulaceae bacterium]MDP7017686.1 DUF1501 domain-containing protein [Pirellulaceae bacterium]
MSSSWLLSRRDLLNRICIGFGGLALNTLLRDQSQAAQRDTDSARIPARARRVIFLFMHGGPSHIDMFDPKPRLTRDDGKKLPFEGSRVKFASRGNLMKSPWKFRPCGQAGLPMSELWQHLPRVADELCMVHSVCETNVAHGGACMKIHTGDEAQLRPSVGSWVSYGLGTENEDLPAFITICPTSLHGGVNNFGSAFLPADHAGVSLGTPGYPNSPAKDAAFEFLSNRRLTHSQQKLQLALLRRLHEESRRKGAADSELEARIKSFELAFRMQTAAPEAMDLSRETQATRDLYGLDEPETANFARECLLARRFAERGVRFIQVSHAHSLPFNNEQWDQHTHLERGHSTNVKQIDKPITALLIDLKQRGLLDDTLVLWGGEFGRTPTVQVGKAEPGRDHHPDGFTMWLAGGGVRGGMRYGKTDEYGYYATENRCTIHDLHATLLHILGLDHERLTWSQDGRDYRLTDVYGEVAEAILA